MDGINHEKWVVYGYTHITHDIFCTLGVEETVPCRPRALVPWYFLLLRSICQVMSHLSNMHVKPLGLQRHSWTGNHSSIIHFKVVPPQWCLLVYKPYKSTDISTGYPAVSNRACWKIHHLSVMFRTWKIPTSSGFPSWPWLITRGYTATIDGFIRYLELLFRAIIVVFLRFFSIFPKQCGHTEGVLTVTVRTRCSIEVGGVVCGIFSCKLP